MNSLSGSIKLGISHHFLLHLNTLVSTSESVLNFDCTKRSFKVFAFQNATRGGDFKTLDRLSYIYYHFPFFFVIVIILSYYNLLVFEFKVLKLDLYLDMNVQFYLCVPFTTAKLTTAVQNSRIWKWNQNV